MKNVLACAVIIAGTLAAEPPAVFRERFARAANGVPEGWEFWTPRPAMKLATAARPGAFRMAGGGNPHAKGRLFREIAGLETGQWYRFEARCAVSKIPNPANAVMAVAEMRGNQNLRAFTPERSGDQVLWTLVLQVPEQARGAVKLHLFAGFIPEGAVEWREVKVTKLPGYKPPTRPVRLAVVDSQPPQPGPAEASARHYAGEIDKACAGAPRTDLVLLPENFNKSKVTPQEPVSFDSAYMRTVRDAARRNRVYVAGSLYEERDGLAFNSGFLIDRQGAIAGYYRKSHLTIGEMMFSQISRGDEPRVFETDFGKIGIAVCFDFHFPELARMLAIKGAGMVLVPMASDGRLKEEGTHRGAEISGKSFVMENRIPVIFAATLGSTKQPSLIIDQNAAVLARSSSEKHIIHATLDLAAKAMRWSGDDFGAIHRVGRRPEMYRPLGLE